MWYPRNLPWKILWSFPGAVYIIGRHRPNRQRKPAYEIRGLANIHPKRPLNKASTLVARQNTDVKD
jgi:hypothetical protein